MDAVTRTTTTKSSVGFAYTVETENHAWRWCDCDLLPSPHSSHPNEAFRTIKKEVPVETGKGSGQDLEFRLRALDGCWLQAVERGAHPRGAPIVDGVQDQLYQPEQHTQPVRYLPRVIRLNRRIAGFFNHRVALS